MLRPPASAACIRKAAHRRGAGGLRLALEDAAHGVSASRGDFGRLEQVFVMLRRGPTMSCFMPPDEGDWRTRPRRPSRSARCFAPSLGCSSRSSRALACVLPTGWCPDAGLLLATALAPAGRTAWSPRCCWPPGSASCPTSLGSLLGEHALLALASSRGARRQQPRQPAGRAEPDGARRRLTAGSALATGALTAFSPGRRSGAGRRPAPLRHAAVNAVVAPFAVAVVRGCSCA